MCNAHSNVKIVVIFAQMEIMKLHKLVRLNKPVMFMMTSEHADEFMNIHDVDVQQHCDTMLSMSSLLTTRDVPRNR